MCFVRYEIREFYEDGNFTYIPFDYEGQAISYIMANPDCKGWLCEVTIGSTWEGCKKLSTCDSIRKKHH